MSSIMILMCKVRVSKSSLPFFSFFFCVFLFRLYFVLDIRSPTQIYADVGGHALN